jgi:folate-binding Fe-S cluster repair protein YgfZ
MFTVFLNVQGRIMFDSIVFRESDESYVLDCDASLSSLLVKHLKMYKVRRRIDITLCDNLQTWSVFKSDQKNGLTESDFLKPEVVSAPDPRFSGLGYRVLTPSNSSSKDLSEMLNQNSVEKGTFKALRHSQVCP